VLGDHLAEEIGEHAATLWYGVHNAPPVEDETGECDMLALLQLCKGLHRVETIQQATSARAKAKPLRLANDAEKET
jgi:hypothetical protein